MRTDRETASSTQKCQFRDFRRDSWSHTIGFPAVRDVEVGINRLNGPAPDQLREYSLFFSSCLAHSDTYKPPSSFVLGQRMPYLALGSTLASIGLLGQYRFSEENFWVCYGISFFFVMIGLTISYNMMIALIPDQVPSRQTGAANAILALLLVGGSLFGFGLFHLFFHKVK
jgi:hypothetical protein